MPSTDAVALIGGVASAVALLSTTVRKRQDLDVDEMRQRTGDLSTRLADAEKEIGSLRAALVKCEQAAFALRRLLAAHGIQEPSEDDHDAAP